LYFPKNFSSYLTTSLSPLFSTPIFLFFFQNLELLWPRFPASELSALSFFKPFALNRLPFPLTPVKQTSFLLTTPKVSFFYMKCEFPQDHQPPLFGRPPTFLFLPLFFFVLIGPPPFRHCVLSLITPDVAGQSFSEKSHAVDHFCLPSF